jgi:hypothetical protein
MKHYHKNPDNELDKDSSDDWLEKALYYILHPIMLVVYLLLYCAYKKFLN